MRIGLSLLMGGLVAALLGATEARQAEPGAPAEVTSMRFEARPAPGAVRAAGDRARKDGSQASEVALVAGDLDADGVLDLISGWSTERGGFLVIHRGAPGGGPAGPGETIETPESPDLLALGDFDRDGRTDLLTAARGGRRLHFLGGDGAGGLSDPVPLPVDGAITALAAGEIDRADGLPDLAVGVEGRQGARLLLFASPDGIFESDPEIVEIPGGASDLAMGQIDDEFPFDLAAAAGRSVLILHGRDVPRHDGRSPARDPLEVRQFPSRIAALALGDFLVDQEARTDLALLTEDGDLLRLANGSAGRPGRAESAERATPAALRPIEGFTPRHLAAARVSTRPGDDLVLWADGDRRVRVIAAAASAGAESSDEALLEMERAPAQVLPARQAGSALDDLAILEWGGGAPIVLEASATAVFTVNSTLDLPDIAPGNGACATSVAGTCTLRAAIQEANALAGFDTIQFSLGAGVPTISPASPLPTITETVAINGNTGGASRVQVTGTAAGAVFGGLRLGFSATTSSGGSQLRDLVINGFAGFGVVIETDGSVVERCGVGTDSMGGATVTGNAAGGILITGAPAKSNSIGGSLSTRCLISSNSGPGITIQSGAATNKVAGNYIGITAAGAPASNAGQGVKIQGSARNNFIGQTAASPGSAPGNVISSNGAAGVEITGAGSNGNLVQGNLIGLAPSGLTALPNATDGVSIALGAQSNTIGGAIATLGNVISGQTFAGGDGVQISNPGSTGNFVQGNLIGTDISGVASLANAQDGVHIDDGAASNTIGGSTAAPGTPPGNVISGNTLNGVRIMSAGSTGNVVLGNVIGTDRTSGTHVRNGSTGVTIDGAPGNSVGGPTVPERNVISGNLGEGVAILNDGAANNRVLGNFIGTDIPGSLPLGNLREGVLINAPGPLGAPPTATGNAIGGDTPTPGKPPGNVISGNALNGVKITGDNAGLNVVSGNLIGTNAAGTAAIANGGSGMGLHDNGVLIVGSPDDNLIGGVTASARNVISGNNTAATSDGVEIRENITNNNLIKGNYIGTDITGTVALANGGNGVFINDGPSGTLVGDVTTAPGVAPGNVISGNDLNAGSCGVVMFGPGTGDDHILGNIIGLNASGTAPLPNRSDGVQITGGATSNSVGSSAPGAGNVISGNGLLTGRAGVRIFDGVSNEVKGNLIGLLASGLAPAGNNGYGVIVTSSLTLPGADANLIGGTLPAERNVISANTLEGIVINGAQTNGNLVQGNYIGTDVTGLGAMGNGSHGVMVTGGADGNVVGGLAGTRGGSCIGACNVIAHNGGAGVHILSGSCPLPGTGPGCSLDNEIRGNRIQTNAGLGIDLAPVGPTLNDALDGDIGSNDLQNYPDIVSASSNGISMTVTGTLLSSFSTTFTIDVYGNLAADPSSWGEGETWLGSTTCATTALSGTCSWMATVPGDTNFVTATATIATPLAADSTSEFSSYFTNPGEVPLLMLAPGAAAGSLDVTYTPACGAIDHAIYMTTGPLGPMTIWNSQFCVSGSSGTATIVPPPVSLGQVQYYKMAGQNGSVEGPYGPGSSGLELPDAVFPVPPSSCERPRELTVTCD